MSLIRSFAWVAAGALLLAGPARSAHSTLAALETAMNEPIASGPPPLRSVTLQVDNQPLTIKPEDAGQIAHALQRYLDAHESTADGVPLPRAAGEPWVDSRGTLRIGTWMLESRGDRLVLTMRDAPQPGTRSGYQLTGALERTRDGWQVLSIGLARLGYR